MRIFGKMCLNMKASFPLCKIKFLIQFFRFQGIAKHVLASFIIEMKTERTNTKPTKENERIPLVQPSPLHKGID